VDSDEFASLETAAGKDIAQIQESKLDRLGELVYSTQAKNIKNYHNASN